jgi:hypothetical protein
MDLPTCIIGAVAPVLAILAEIKSPVDRTILKNQGFENAEQYVSALTGVDKDRQKNAISNTIAGTAIGAAEASGLIPTWISFVIGISSVLVEIVNPCVLISFILAFTILSSLFSIPFFTQLNYFVFGAQASRWRICRGRTGAECASRGVIFLNLLVMLLVVGDYLYTDAGARDAIGKAFHHFI